METTPLIIAGMQQSGNSLIASLLQNAGVNLGNKLTPTTDKNQKEDFEKVDFDQFYQEVLRSQGANSNGWTLRKNFTIPAKFIWKVDQIIKINSVSKVWGWQDFRNTLFLDFWANFLPKAKFLLIYRAPWEVVDSLYCCGEQIFETEPELAVKYWLNYNQQIIDFYNQYPERCLLTNIKKITNNYQDYIDKINEMFSLDLTYPDDKIYRPQLLNNNIDQSYISLINFYFPQVVEMYHRLEFKSCHEADIFQNWQSLRQQQTKNKSLESINNKYQQQIKDLETKNKSLEGETKKYQQQLKQTESTLNNKKQELENTQHDLETVKKQLTQSQGDILRYQSQLHFTQEELEKSELNNTQYQQQLQDLETKNKSLEGETKKYQQQIKDFENLLQTNRQQLKQTESTLNNKKQELENTQHDLETVKKQLTQSQGDVLRYQSQLHFTQEELEKSELSKQELQLEFKQIQPVLNRLTNELEKANQNETKLRLELYQMQTISAELAHSAQERERAEIELQKLESQIKNQEIILCQLTNQLEKKETIQEKLKLQLHYFEIEFENKVSSN